MKDRKLVTREHAIAALERHGFPPSLAVSSVERVMFEHRGMLVVRRSDLSRLVGVSSEGEEGGDGR